MKYKSVRTTVNGITFDSKSEARRYEVLRLLERDGRISELQLQPSFVLAPAVRFSDVKRQKPALKYVADFEYIENGVTVIEDVKGMQTPVFKIKRHLLKTVHGIDVRITK